MDDRGRQASAPQNMFYGPSNMCNGSLTTVMCYVPLSMFYGAQNAFAGWELGVKVRWRGWRVEGGRWMVKGGRREGGGGGLHINHSKPINV